ncbi:uncharacterized protein LOC128278310 [Anopheles cruzii]|uniref:uncharacterized protein LOC128278310 n=1 Tax=Anopheles cruzii TaxID=68878 RepID=UPI0022EC968B|nr:uncharacterized protein LOC128278310 [Anopheles cruzii]
MEQKKHTSPCSQHLEVQAAGENVLLDDEPGFNLFENMLPNFPMEESNEELPVPEPKDELSSPFETGSVCDMNIDQRLQIRHDCMWSGVCVDLSHPEKFGLGLGEGCCIDGGGDPLVLLAQEQQRNQLQNLAHDSGNVAAPTASHVAKAGNTSPKESTETLKPQPTPFRVPTTVAEIPAGSSLLIKRPQQQQQPQSRGITSGNNYSTNMSTSTSTLRLPYIPNGAFMKNREHHILSGALHHHTSSNTPLSADDDPPEFKHKLDLVATCTVGYGEAPAATVPAAPSASSAVSSSGVSGENIALNYCNQTAQMIQDDPVTVHLNAGYMRSTSTEPLGGQLWTAADSSDNGFSSNSLSQLLHDLREIEERDSTTLSSAFSFFSQTIDNSSVRSSGVCGDQGSCSDFHYWNGGSSSSNRSMTKSSSSLVTSASLASDLNETTVTAAIKKVALTTVTTAHPFTCSSSRNEKTLVENDDAEDDDAQEDELLFDTATSGSPATVNSSSFEKDDDDEEEDMVKRGDIEKDDELSSDASVRDSPRSVDSSFTSCSEEDDDDEEEDVEKKADRPQKHNKRFSDAAARESTNYVRCSSTSCSEEDDNDDEEDFEKRTSGFGSSNGYGPVRATRRLALWCQRRQDVTGRLGDGGQPAKKRKLNKIDSLSNFDRATLPPSVRDSSVGRRRGGDGSTTSSDSLPFEGHQATHVGDHSYTRPKGHFNMNDLGVQTPSESGKLSP